MNKNTLKKVGLISGLVSQGVLILCFAVGNFLPDIIYNILELLFIVGAIVGYVLIGGVAFKAMFKICKKVFIAGWILLPFPADIFTGLFTSMMAFSFGILAIFFCPGIIVVVGYFDYVRKEK
ncbi:MAG: hypothetical protein ACI4E1_03525 [Lachnospira sp.]